jgi:hypothetical protein
MDAKTIEELDPAALAEVRRANSECFKKAYAEGGASICILDQHFPGLVVPDHVRDLHPLLVLVYDVDPIIPIPDLDLGELGISATLSFDRRPYRTFVPWEAIAGIGCTSEPARPARRGLKLVP